MDKSKRINSYHKAYIKEYEFESVQVRQRQRLVLELIKRNLPDTVIEIGCGADLLYSRVVADGLPVSKWIIVEPNSHFASIARTANEERVQKFVIQEFFEAAGEDIKRVHDAPVNLILCSGVLNEVPMPGDLINAARSWMSEDSIFHVNVPNAQSFHRQLAVTMGLISDVKEFSGRNKTLQQYRVYDMTTLQREVQECGFVVEDSGGYFIKPFTHDQMVSIKTVLKPELLDGLWELGRKLPELASEIYINAKLRT